MTTSLNESRVPELTLGWRLKMALGDVSAGEMADYLEVSRQTLTRWMGDAGAPPRRPYILQWAMRTGVDAHWLETGVPSSTNPEGGATGGESVGLHSADRLTTQEYVSGLRLMSAA